ncbi:MAG: PleD family two-component system response regulator [Spirochaetia bacterium]
MQKSEPRYSVLIVDDVNYNIKMLANALKDEYRIKIATNGNKAIEIASSEEDPPDLILLDVVMPEMDGYEVCRRLKNEPSTQKIPVIFVTARDEAADEEYGLNLGAVDYVTKPFHKAILKARVRNHVDLKLKNDLLENLATMDGLTHIPNRRSFDTVLQKERDRAVREREPLTIVLMDIDNFKAYNDNYGHGKGDVCLESVAKALSGCAGRPADIVARYGGEEFAAILPNTDEEGGIKKAEEFRRSVEDLEIPHEFSETSCCVTISVGVQTGVPASDDTPEALSKKADEALYQSKKEGRNRVTSASAMG